MELTIRGGLVLLEGGLIPAAVHVEDGAVAAIGGAAGRGREIDASGCVVAPSFIDLHAHLRWPGGLAAEEPEDVADAALLGGFTTVVAMANTAPAIDTPARVREAMERYATLPIEVIQAAAATQGRGGERPVDVRTLAEAGVRVLTDDGDAIARADVALAVFEQAARYDLLVAQHASVPELSGGVMNAGPLADRLGYRGVPEVAEAALVARDLELARASGVRYHLQHLSARESLNLIRAARRDGLRVSCEVTPHHLGLEEGELSAHDARFRVNPPLRSRATRMALLEALLSGGIDAVATDHAPHPDWAKDVPLEQAAPGMLGLCEAFPAVWTAVLEHRARLGASAEPIPGDWEWLGDEGRDALTKVLRAFTTGPGGVLGRSRTLAVGAPADLVVLDPAGRTVGGGRGAYRSSNSPWAGRELTGSVRWVLREGRIEVEEGQRVRA